MKKLFLFLLICFAGQNIFAASFLDSLKEKFKLPQKVDSISIQSNLEIGDLVGSKNYFSYKTSGSNKSTHKDKFDAVTGASLNNSTKKIKELQVDSGKKIVLPKGLCKFFMFCVSEQNVQQVDLLKVDSGENGKVTISFVHRGTYYLIQSQENGILDFNNCFYYQENICQNHGGKFELPQDFVPLQKRPKVDDNIVENCDNTESELEGTSVDETSEKESDKNSTEEKSTDKNSTEEKPTAEFLTEDVPDKDAQFFYKGNLIVTFDGKNVCIKGKLKKSDPVKVEPEKVEEPESTESTGQAAEK